MMKAVAGSIFLILAGCAPTRSPQRFHKSEIPDSRIVAMAVALESAIRAGDCAHVMEMIGQGAVYWGPIAREPDALALALRHGHLEIAEALIRLPRLKIHPQHGVAAVRGGHWPSVLWVMEKGGEAARSWLWVSYAAFEGRSDWLPQLHDLLHGASPASEPPEGTGAIYWALAGRHLDLLPELARLGYRPSAAALHKMILSSPSPDPFRACLTFLPELERPSGEFDKVTPLVLAISMNHSAWVSFLFGRGAQLTPAVRKEAFHAKSPEVIQFLLSYGMMVPDAPRNSWQDKPLSVPDALPQPWQDALRRMSYEKWGAHLERSETLNGSVLEEFLPVDRELLGLAMGRGYRPAHRFLGRALRNEANRYRTSIDFDQIFPSDRAYWVDDNELADLMGDALSQTRHPGSRHLLPWLLGRSGRLPNPFALRDKVWPEEFAQSLDQRSDRGNPLLGLLALDRPEDAALLADLALLLRYGADPEEGRPLRSPLAFAASRGRFRVCEALVAAGADVNAMVVETERADEPLDRVYKGTPLHHAFRRKQRHVVDWLLDQRAIRADISDSEGMTAYDLALSTGDEGLIRHIQERSVPLRSTSPEDRRQRAGTMSKDLLNRPAGTVDLCLEWAMKPEAIEPGLVQELEARGWPVAEIVQRSARTKAELLRPAFVPWLKAKGIRLGSILEAFQPFNRRYVQTKADVEALVNLGCSFDLPGANGMTPLMWHAARGNPVTLRALLEKGADPSARSPDGKTALEFAQNRLSELEKWSGKGRKGAAAEYGKWVADGGVVAPLAISAIALPLTLPLGLVSMHEGAAARRGMQSDIMRCREAIELLLKPPTTSRRAQ